MLTQKLLFSNWHFMRWLRLGLGIFIAFQAVQLHDALAGFVAAFFLFQAITNTGCCGSGSCAIPTEVKKMDKAEDIEWQEIKSNEK